MSKKRKKRGGGAEMKGKEQIRRCFFSLFLKVDALTDL